MTWIRFNWTCILVVLAKFSVAQGSTSSPALTFPDSVRIVLENSRNVDAMVIATSFSSGWPKLQVDQQLTIQRQLRLLRGKKYPLKPSLINYFGSIANAVNVENADAAKISEWLSVAQQVIEKDPISKANAFFAASRDFFQHHALHYERTLKWYALDDEYSFEYLEPAATFDLNSPIPESEAPPETYDDPLVENRDDDASASDFGNNPLWMNPPPLPDQTGPVVKFSKVTLNLVTKYDSVMCKETSGAFSLRDHSFKGEGGTFDWTSAGLSSDSVVCQMGPYYFFATKGEVKSDLVKLNYEGKTPGFIPGTFEFKSENRRDSVLSTFPRFRSFQNDLVIQGIGDKNVRYRGGFSLIGNKILGASVSGDPATLEIYSSGEKKFEAIASEFRFFPQQIESQKSKIKITQGRDSITHPAVRIKYSFDDDSIQRLVVQRDKGSMKHTPYASSFFNVDFSGDIIHWDMLTDSLNILTDGGRHTVPLIIESVDFYDAEDYRLLKGEGFNFHPLALVANYCIKNRTRQFYSGDLSSATQINPRDIKAAIEFLSIKGLVTYDQKTDIIYVKEKALTIYRASKGEKDYDNMKIHSVIDSSANVTLNVKDGYMRVRGVEEFNLSDSLNVRIEPASSIITILQNRDLNFDGTIHAGNFEISGKNFTLQYDSFLIVLRQIDSINFYVTEKNTKGHTVRRKINNSMVGADSTAAAAGGLGDISKSSGTLYISKANNKSGKKKIPNYPRLDATTGGVIYFDREDVLNGAYDRSMFFVVPPFKLDSLNDADPASINFVGTFVSSGMFPNFKERLHTMPDKSLGFTHNIPLAGYKLYNGDGNLSGDLRLDTRGLRGTGTIKYLAATVTSPDFIFYPDSVIGAGSDASIEKKQFGEVLFPQANLTDYTMKWYPKEDRMLLKNRKAPFAFYNNTAQMQGTLTISKNGVSGAGKLDTRGTELISRNMNFTGNDFSARHGRFKVNSEDPAKPLLSGTDIRVRFNLNENYADLSPEVEGVAAIDFPYAQFKTSISDMRWDLNSQKITMNKAEDVDLEDSYFYTTRKDLDSLRFNADHAEYDLKTQQLKVSGIPYIVVADAKITPENNEVLILENAKIGTLKNTVIVVDTLNGYHRLTEGVVDIISRNEFSGYATYQYVNFLRDTFPIKMTNFRLEPVSDQEKSRRSQKRRTSAASLQTVADGSVSDKDFLVLGAGMFYKGDMTMFATRPALELSGYVKLDIKKIKGYNTWIKYDQTGDETEVAIDFATAVTEEGKKVEAGLFFESQSNDLYITFLNEKASDEDEPFFSPSGVLYYDTATSEFKIEDLEKARGNKLSGEVFAYNDNNTQVKFEGQVKFLPPNKDFALRASALGEGNLQSNEIRMNTFLIMETNVPTTAFDVMARQLQEVIKNEGADEGLGDQTELLYKIANLVGERTAKEYEQKSLEGYVPLGTLPEMVKPLVFSNVNLKWSHKFKAFYSDGKLGLANSGRNDINAAFEGFMEVKKTQEGGTNFNVFFKASPEAWYFFGFEDNRLFVHSSNSEFNSQITKRSNVGKVKIGEVAFLPGSDDETLTFINRFRRDYYGIDIPYDLNEGVSTAVKKKDEKADDDGF